MDTRWPQWTEELTTKIVPGEDHLGVEGAAQSYQQYLVPGIITTTDHARYYSFYAWVLHRFIKDSSRLLKDFRGSYFKRHEVALIVGSYSHHKDEGGLSGLVGSGNNNANARRMWDSGNSMSLDAEYFQNSLGGFGLYYRTVMQTMGLIEENEEPNWVYRLTTRGKQLAKAYEESLKDTGYFKLLTKDGALRRLSRQDAAEYGQVGCICPEALAHGKDRELLREAFFRFDQTGGRTNPHVRRRRSLGVALDLVHGAKGKLEWDMIRPALYLGEYSAGRNYTPTKHLQSWIERWKMVEIRHHYSFGMQCLFAAFLFHLSDQGSGISFPEYMDWASQQLPEGLATEPSSEYLAELCHAVGLRGGWRAGSKSFDQECLQSTELDEHSLYHW